LIEDAYRLGETLGLAVWCGDEAGPFQTAPQPGQIWRPEGDPVRQPHEYVRNGTAKALTPFRPADGRVRIEGVTACPNGVLRPWLRREPSEVLAGRPDAPPAAKASRAAWERWQAGLAVKPTPPAGLPPLRMPPALDNLTGHKTPEFVLWLFAHGTTPIYTPAGGSRLNMAESIQRAPKRRALDGRRPATPAEIIAWFEAVAGHWNSDPTPFEWGGKRAARRGRQRERRHRLGGSGAQTRRPIARKGRRAYGHVHSK
jgi:hypothetical protein